MHDGERTVNRFIAAIVIAAVLSGLAVWQVQSWRWEAKVAKIEREYADKKQRAESQARATEQKLQRESERISNEATIRERKLAATVTASRTAANSLRDEIARLNARPVSADPGIAAIAVEAASAREQLGKCAEEYRAVAQGADELRDQLIGLQDWVSQVCQQAQK